MKRITYTRPDGGLSVIIPVISRGDPPDFTEEDALQRAMKDVPTDAQNVTVMDVSELPQDRTYRNAWEHSDGKIAHNMAKAAEVHRDILRQQRAPLLSALDVEYQRADERGDAKAKADIARRKQALRDITKHPGIETAKTVDDLKTITL